MALKTNWSYQRSGPAGLPLHTGGMDPIDVHVGGRLRLRRMTLGVSQSALAEHLGLTFQQIQKYESGGNRVSASKLYRAATFLSCPISFFFEGLSTPEADEHQAAAQRRAELILSNFLSKPEAFEMAVEFPKLRSRRLRKQIVRLVRQIADEAERDLPDDEGDEP